MRLDEIFEAARPRLLSLAHRLVGSHHDAEDAVQAAWVRAATADPAELINPEAWLTTVTTRLCLYQLRARRRRGELPLRADDVPGDQTAADEAFLRREEVSRAFMVVLAELSPAQRVAYVLHDLFAVPFEQVSVVLGTTTGSAKKLASRARARLRDAGPAESPRHERQVHVVEAFLAAARGGDIGRLVALLSPDVVRDADPALLRGGAQATVSGATAVAEETRTFLDRIAVAAVVLIDGRPGAVIAPGGRPSALLRFRFQDTAITHIDITRYARGSASISALPPSWPESAWRGGRQRGGSPRG
ncbi:RNA polymerase sigma-70 factor (ECF subfamily) [Catenuloplanes nepalensis]|uniref:RNA polymerase sigma-70 factor (ECF subfamily) n=1 Tax=Catenuloplanes nepalensis TaxID=587533 RepID=A0ABT9MRG8_9ACTN|nr:sigma-70 family RNA polymerase sigma factor [Catenuloplanes nepalensis]MDP9794032.1 RNA polymerase sigma-70 factor (ECF subfamily) [Catenuloplanes nepalensis]